uniref:Uncharacterized protein n=1 Tax=Corethron hystrix TaxID=216773 RepID=A0A7S1FUJ1_9STRA
MNLLEERNCAREEELQHKERDFAEDYGLKTQELRRITGHLHQLRADHAEAERDATTLRAEQEALRTEQAATIRNLVSREQAADSHQRAIDAVRVALDRREVELVARAAAAGEEEETLRARREAAEGAERRLNYWAERARSAAARRLVRVHERLGRKGPTERAFRMWWRNAVLDKGYTHEKVATGTLAEGLEMMEESRQKMEREKANLDREAEILAAQHAEWESDFMTREHSLKTKMTEIDAAYEEMLHSKESLHLARQQFEKDVALLDGLRSDLQMAEEEVADLRSKNEVIKLRLLERAQQLEAAHGDLLAQQQQVQEEKKEAQEKMEEMQRAVGEKEAVFQREMDEMRERVEEVSHTKISLEEDRSKHDIAWKRLTVLEESIRNREGNAKEREEEIEQKAVELEGLAKTLQEKVMSVSGMMIYIEYDCHISYFCLYIFSARLTCFFIPSA